MQSINLSALDGLTKDLDKILQEMPEKNRELHEKLADLAKAEVDAQISASGINDSSGKVKDWQKEHVGSRGGYAAVRPSDSSTGNNSPGAITNYLTSGHKIRRPSGKSKRYRPKIKTPYVDGRHFYQIAQTTVESKAIDLVNDFTEGLAERLGG